MFFLITKNKVFGFSSSKTWNKPPSPPSVLCFSAGKISMNPLYLHKLRVFANRFSQKSINWATISSNSNPPIPIPILISRRTLTTRIQSQNSPNLGLLSTPWTATQLRPKYCGSDVSHFFLQYTYILVYLYL